MFRSALLPLLIVALAAGTSHAEMIIEHVGLTNPTTEDDTLPGLNRWQESTAGSGTFGPGGTEGGVQYWKITEAASGRYRYEYKPASLGTTLADPSGWTLTGKIKLHVAGGGLGDVAINVRDGSDTWMLGFDATGAYVSESTGIVYFDTTVDPTDGYHTYQIIFDPVGAGTSDDLTRLYVDGVLGHTYDRAAAPNNASTFAAFGGFVGDALNTTPESRWNYVSLQTGQHPIPEPSSLLLAGLGGLLLLAWRGRRRVRAGT